MTIRSTAATLGLIACLTTYDLAAAEDGNDAAQAAQVFATEVCSVCHGPGGRSPSASAPNLAAQPWRYLLGKIKLFRDRSVQTNDHVYVVGLTLIDDPTADALAHYFARQPPPEPVSGDADLMAAGNKIFTQGSPEHGIPACAVCHGANAAGFGIFPRLAGQHAEYVQRQLGLIQSRLRDSAIMHGVIKDMTPEQMKAVAAFVQSK